MTIIIDAAGGLLAPEAAIQAAARSSLERDLELLLVGDEGRITDTLTRLAHNPARLMVHHGGDTPALSVNAAAARLGAERGAALVTATDPGLLTRAAAEHLALARGVLRPALCAVYPTARRRGRAQDPFVLILDVGASFEASADDLVGYARMGAAYAARVSHNPRPRVALLGERIGQQVGPPATAEAAEALQRLDDLDFHGVVSGLEIPRGGADVIVCPGFVGNVVIKMLEGVGEVVAQLTESLRTQSIRGRLAVQALSADMDALASLTDWKSYGGAPLLGYDKPIIAIDPSADADAFERAIRLAAKTIRTDVVGAITG